MRMERQIDKKLKDHFEKYGLVLVLSGPRQVGKTTVLKRLFPDAKYFLLDEERLRKVFETFDSLVYKQNFGGSDFIVLDEVHLLSNPGRAVKIIHDLMPEKKVIITGSSALNIKNKTAESLAGRKIEYKMWPLTVSEYFYQTEVEEEMNFDVIENILGNKEMRVRLFNLKEMTKHLLVYGNYPFLVNNSTDQIYLRSLSESVIFKDIVDLHLIENKKVAGDMLKLLAFQVGNMVNYAEIASKLSVDVRTIQKYIEIFEQSYILFRVYPLMGNKRQEIIKRPKIYFYDNGIRNGLINNFVDVDNRADKGALFENFVVSEVMKVNSYGDYGFEMNFWRTKDGSEVDLVLSRHGEMYACEIKFDKGSVSKAFTNRYPEAKTRVITAENYY